MKNILMLLLVMVSLSHALVKPFTFVSGTKAKASQVNANDDSLYNWVNNYESSTQPLYMKKSDYEERDSTMQAFIVDSLYADSLTVNLMRVDTGSVTDFTSTRGTITTLNSTTGTITTINGTTATITTINGTTLIIDSINSNTIDVGRIRSDSVLSVIRFLEDVTMDKDLTVTGTLSVDTITGSIRFLEAVTLNKDLTVTGKIVVDTLDGNITITGDLLLNGKITVDTLNGNVRFLNNVIIDGTLSTTGLSTLSSVDINGGNIDGTAIGSASATTGKFTTITSDSSFSAVHKSQRGRIDTLFSPVLVTSVINGALTVNGLSELDSIHCSLGIATDNNLISDKINTGQGLFEIGQDNLTTSTMQFGRVGVGVSPTAPLHVYENNSIADILLENPTNGQALYYSKTGLGEWISGTGDAGNYVIYDVDRSQFRMFMDTLGRTSIGVSQTPLYTLDVFGDFRANTINTGLGDFEIGQSNRTTDIMTFAGITTNGRLKISNDSLLILHPSGGTETILSMRNYTNDAYGWDYTLESLVTGDLYMNRIVNNVRSHVYTIERATGYFGIGTTNPDQPLDVTGAILSDDGRLITRKNASTSGKRAYSWQSNNDVMELDLLSDDLSSELSTGFVTFSTTTATVPQINTGLGSTEVLVENSGSFSATLYGRGTSPTNDTCTVVWQRKGNIVHCKIANNSGLVRCQNGTSTPVSDYPYLSFTNAPSEIVPTTTSIFTYVTVSTYLGAVTYNYLPRTWDLTYSSGWKLYCINPDADDDSRIVGISYSSFSYTLE